MPFIKFSTSSIVGGLRGSGNLDIAIAEQALAKRTILLLCQEKGQIKQAKINKRV